MSLAVAVDKPLAIAKAAAIVGVHPNTLRSYANQGLVNCYILPGGHRRFNRQDLDELRNRLLSKEPIEDPTDAQAKKHYGDYDADKLSNEL